MTNGYRARKEEIDDLQINQERNREQGKYHAGRNERNKFPDAKQEKRPVKEKD